MRPTKPIGLLDVDGVCIKWQSGLPYFCGKHNLPLENVIKCNLGETYMQPEDIFNTSKEMAQRLMTEYNNSKFIRYLQPYMDALEFINTYKDKYHFVAVTALSSKTDAIMNRMFNLNSLFPGAFIDVMSCNFGESKYDMFRHVIDLYGHNIKFFVDDLGSNLEACQLAIEHHNKESEKYDPIAEELYCDNIDIRLFHLLRGERELVNNTQTIDSLMDPLFIQYIRD